MKTFQEWLLLQEKANEEAWELLQMGSATDIDTEAEPVKRFYQSLIKSIAKTPEEEQDFYYGGATTGGTGHWDYSANIPIKSPLNQLALKITKYINTTPIVPLSKLGISIPQLKNLGNKKELAALAPQGGSPAGWEKFANVIGASRSAEGRKTNYLNLLQKYTDPSVLLRLGNEYYVIGGRTRLTASYATGRDAPVKVIDAGKLQQVLAQWMRK